MFASDVAFTGVAIAAAVGVTQRRAAQILKRLVGLDAVAVTSDGYLGKPAVLLDLYRTRTCPNLVEPESQWYSPRRPSEQATRVQTLAHERGVTIAFSANLTAELLVPWRHPTVTIAYVDDGLCATNAGFLPAEGRADASLILRWADDHRLLSAIPPWVDRIDGHQITDPCQQWWDLLDLGGEDRAEAADRLGSANIARSLPRTR